MFWHNFKLKKRTDLVLSNLSKLEITQSPKNLKVTCSLFDLAAIKLTLIKGCLSPVVSLLGEKMQINGPKLLLYTKAKAFLMLSYERNLRVLRSS